MLYFQRLMNKLIRPFLLLVISLLLFFLSVAFSVSRQIPADQLKQHTGALITFQATLTPEVVEEEEDQSVVGSTDGITVMSFVIAAIILIPIFLKRRSWDANVN